jgi:glutamyl-Q tRNA(Asp) synthetase
MGGYRGRFAPSPTGPLHFGSLVAATASYLDARAAGGEWLVRIEDVDRPRSVPGAADEILRTLERFGFAWDGSVVYQSARQDLYLAALEHLKQGGFAFPCGCSRREIETGQNSVYPGTCRGGLHRERAVRSWRVRVPEDLVCFDDRVQGRWCQQLASEVGDFVVLRADGFFAYQLAVVVDDGEQGITDVVRGVDLMDSTPRQLYLQRLLASPTPRYLHVPVAVNSRGEKLSKQTLAAPAGCNSPVETLHKVLRFLGQSTPEETLNLADFWDWAIGHWRPDTVPAERACPAPAE